MATEFSGIKVKRWGLGLILHAGLAGGDEWKEFLLFFRESKFIHITCIDFTLLSSFALFWVYNDVTARKWYDKGSWHYFLYHWCHFWVHLCIYSYGHHYQKCSFQSRKLH